jgi:hypothetical protein
MKRSKAILLLLVSFTLLRSAPSFADDCTPRGTVVINGQLFYDYIANGEPGSTACWSLLHAVFVTGQNSCGPFSPTYNAFQFNDSSSVHQEFTIRTDLTSRRFALTFDLDFQAPIQHGGQNYLYAEVVDRSTGQVLKNFQHDGTKGNVFCHRVDVPLDEADLAGHELMVRFISQRRDATAAIRVYSISFFQG